MAETQFLISPADLGARIGDPRLRVVDASWYLPVQGRDAKAEFASAHVPGAVFFDQDAIVDPASPLPHALPSPEVFAKAAGSLGIAETDAIVVYDGLGLFSAARVWWMFRTFGAGDVRLLDGGFPAWRTAGLPTESGAPSPGRKRFVARFDSAAVVGFDEMRGLVAARGAAIADARPAERFEGRVAEPRAGVRAGHMPGARCLPFSSLVDAGRLKSPEALRSAFAEAGIDPAAAVVTSCGSGVTAAVVNLALESLGNRRSRLYDGSWTQWGSAADTPIETGPAAPWATGS